MFFILIFKILVFFKESKTIFREWPNYKKQLNSKISHKEIKNNKIKGQLYYVIEMIVGYILNECVVFINYKL